MALTGYPDAKATNRAVMGKLKMSSGLSAATLGIDMSFNPSIGITARRIDKLGLDIRSFKVPLTRSIGQVMTHSFQDNFNAGGRPDAWQPLSEATLEIKERMGWSGGDILIRSGNLRRVMGQINIWHITKDTAMIRDLPAKVWYGALHQGGHEGNSMSKRLRAHGGDAKKALDSLLDNQFSAMQSGKSLGGGGGSIPARPFVMFQDEDEDLITEVFIEWLNERIVKRWGAI